MTSLKDIEEVFAYWAHIWHDGGHTPFLFWNAVVLGEHLVYNCQSDAKAKNQGTYRTRAIITRSLFETALDYKPQILGPTFLVYVLK